MTWDIKKIEKEMDDYFDKTPKEKILNALEKAGLDDTTSELVDPPMKEE